MKRTGKATVVIVFRVQLAMSKIRPVRRNSAKEKEDEKEEEEE